MEEKIKLMKKMMMTMRSQLDLINLVLSMKFTKYWVVINIRLERVFPTTSSLSISSIRIYRSQQSFYPNLLREFKIWLTSWFKHSIRTLTWAKIKPKRWCHIVELQLKNTFIRSLMITYLRCTPTKIKSKMSYLQRNKELKGSWHTSWGSKWRQTR